MSGANGSVYEGKTNASYPSHPVNPFTLRDLYVRASISGNSLAAELGHFLNIDETTFASSSREYVKPHNLEGETTVHEQALAAIIDAVISNSNSGYDFIRVPEPPGGVQDWWARMLDGSDTTTEPSGPPSAVDEL